MAAPGRLPNGEPIKAWKLQPDGTWLSPTGWRMFADGSVQAPKKGQPLPPGTPPVPSPQNSVNVALAQYGAIIDRWNMMYPYDQVSAKNRTFLIANPSAFTNWYASANAKQVRMDAANALSSEALANYKGSGAPGQTLKEKASYYPAKVERAAMKNQKMRAGMSGTDAYNMRVARELAAWGSPKPTPKPRR